MTRLDEIKKKMLELEEETPNWKDTTVYVAGFMDGAMWADQHPHWISVKEELPKIEEANCEWVGSDDVLALLWNGDMSVGRYERDNISGEYYWILYNVDKDHEVTHWMRLPQPPKKGD